MLKCRYTRNPLPLFLFRFDGIRRRKDLVYTVPSEPSQGEEGKATRRP